MGLDLLNRNSGGAMVGKETAEAIELVMRLLTLFFVLLTVIFAYLSYKAFQVKIKEGVSLEGISWRMFWAAIVADAVFLKYGREAVLTSGVDGEHSEHSLHYKGLALDFRTRDLDPEQVPSVAEDLQNALGKDYAVIVEKDHIHAQYTWENIRGGNPYA